MDDQRMTNDAIATGVQLAVELFDDEVGGWTPVTLMVTSGWLRLKSKERAQLSVAFTPQRGRWRAAANWFNLARGKHATCSENDFLLGKDGLSCVLRIGFPFDDDLQLRLVGQSDISFADAKRIWANTGE
jgi:hypothetical protein